ncbi:hypothetical protein [Clostridium lacusfryxellense]|uniref:hypothetical protein n=1 Tax=Clostridium lacusfryxellense TaxID=205328 RepID=UPI001FEC1883|nr:hypothetical protein [Clostridium lacusfryxellense]
MIIGGRAHDFGKLSLEELTAKVSKQGYTHVQLALDKAIYGIDCSLGKLSPGLGTILEIALKKKMFK